MGRWSREEIEEAFDVFQATALEAGKTGDWNDFADLFTEDAHYVEHLYGEMGGREAIRKWITKTMSTPPANEMVHFPIEWYIIDTERAWAVCQVWNRMADPGDGSLHQAYNWTLLKYAGNGKWRYEEDVYNPHHFAKMIARWSERKAKLAARAEDS